MRPLARRPGYSLREYTGSRLGRRGKVISGNTGASGVRTHIVDIVDKRFHPPFSNAGGITCNSNNNVMSPVRA